MQIQASRVAVGAIVGAGVAAAAALGLSGPLDQELLEKGAASVADALTSGAVPAGDVGYYVPPSGYEQFVNHLGDEISKAGSELGKLLAITPDRAIEIQTLTGPVTFTEAGIDKLQTFLDTLPSDHALRAPLETVISDFHKSAVPAVASVVSPVAPLAPAPLTPGVQLAESIKALDALGDGISQTHPSQIPGLQLVNLPNGGELYLDPEGFVKHYNTLAALPGTSDTGLLELKNMVAPSYAGVAGIAGAGAVVGAGLGAMSDGKPENNRRFTDRVQSKAPPVALVKKPEEQNWVQTVQAGAEQTPPQIVR